MSTTPPAQQLAPFQDTSANRPRLSPLPVRFGHLVFNNPQLFSPHTGGLESWIIKRQNRAPSPTQVRFGNQERKLDSYADTTCNMNTDDDEEGLGSKYRGRIKLAGQRLRSEPSPADERKQLRSLCQQSGPGNPLSLSHPHVYVPVEYLACNAQARNRSSYRCFDFVEWMLLSVAKISV